MLPIILRWTFFIYEWTFLNKTCSCAKFTLSHVQYTQKQNMAYQITWNLLPRLWILRFQKPFAFPTYQWNKTVILTKDYIRCMFVCFFFSHVNTNFHSHCIQHYQWLMRRDANELPNTRSCSCLSTWGLALSVLQFNLFMKHPVLKQCYLLRCNIYVYFKMWWNRISVGN